MKVLHWRMKSAPTKPSNLGSAVFVGATPAGSPKIESGPGLAVWAPALGALNRAGVGIMRPEGVATIGVLVGGMVNRSFSAS